MSLKGKLIGLCIGASVTLTSYGMSFAAGQISPVNAVAEAGHTEMRLEEKAKAKGITVEELKQRIAERKAKLEKEAKEKGISVEELKKQKKAERHAKLEGEAKAKGITVEELIKQKKADDKSKH